MSSFQKVLLYNIYIYGPKWLREFDTLGNLTAKHVG